MSRMVSLLPCICISCLIASKMPLRHRRSSAGVAPRLDARPCLKNGFPSAGDPPTPPVPRFVVVGLLHGRFLAPVFVDQCYRDAPRLFRRLAFSTSTAAQCRCSNPAPLPPAVLLLSLAAPLRS